MLSPQEKILDKLQEIRKVGAVKTQNSPSQHPLPLSKALKKLLVFYCGRIFSRDHVFGSSRVLEPLTRVGEKLTGLVFPGVSASDEPDSVLRRRGQEPGGSGQPADRRTAPPADQRRVRPAAEGTSGHQE